MSTAGQLQVSSAGPLLRSSRLLIFDAATQSTSVRSTWYLPAGGRVGRSHFVRANALEETAMVSKVRCLPERLENASCLAKYRDDFAVGHQSQSAGSGASLSQHLPCACADLAGRAE